MRRIILSLIAVVFVFVFLSVQLFPMPILNTGGLEVTATDSPLWQFPRECHEMSLTLLDPSWKSGYSGGVIGLFHEEYAYSINISETHWQTATGVVPLDMEDESMVSIISESQLAYVCFDESQPLLGGQMFADPTTFLVQTHLSGNVLLIPR